MVDSYFTVTFNLESLQCLHYASCSAFGQLISKRVFVGKGDIQCAWTNYISW